MELLAEVPAEIPCPHCHRMVNVEGCAAFQEVECPQCDKEFEVPADFGRFRLYEVAGAGKMGVVFKAYDNSVNMQVGLKVARTDNGKGCVFYDSLMNEIKTAGRIRHKNLIEIYDYGEHDGHPYIAMQYIMGGTLRNRLDIPYSHQKERKVLKWAIEMCQGLNAAKKSGVVHGDLKPANILFDHNEMVKLADFGLARAEGQASSEVWGTPMYIAPEKALCRPETFQSDMYSLGIILWQTLSGGTPPYNDPDAATLVQQHVDAPIPDLLELVPECSYHTSIILRRMMAKVPERRFTSYEYLLAELNGALKAAERKSKNL